MSDNNHEWAIFFKRRLKLSACANCGELNLPSNKENNCIPADISDSQIVRAGYRIRQSLTLV
jgi:hypothetical protein